MKHPYFAKGLMIAQIDSTCGNGCCTVTSGCSPTSSMGCNAQRYAMYGSDTTCAAAESSAATLELHRAQVSALVEDLTHAILREAEPPTDAPSEIDRRAMGQADSDLEVVEVKLEQALEELRARRRQLQVWQKDPGPQDEE